VAGARDIYGFRPGADSVPVPLLTAAHDEVDPDVSPDGRWLAYTSNETGRYEVFVRPFPDVESGRWQISVNGGLGARWANSGGEIFFRDAADNFVRVAVDGGSTFRYGPPETMFAIPDGIQLGDLTFSYAVAPDDQRFLMGTTDPDNPGAAGDTTPAAVLVLNFFEELRRLAPR
jgi:serine/threonine-protein kinase